ncbi:putative peptidylglycine alpha-hydroxylating monooxygenase 1 isoform X3 [Tubulanus polymorphus]|uniref:putative peptidylglycine alpha-hydroxylating monooxygenase 1 isoform X3 n=1 Tax=Tubulanus polymorphus TaxID=672921 RepID=UPI003DA5930C
MSGQSALRIWTWIFCLVSAVGAKQNKIFVQMPNVQPKVHDTYMCTAMKMNSTEYVVSFTPKQSKPHTAHHMLLYGCESPGFKDSSWDCGEMHSGDGKTMRQGPTCASGAKIIYAWAMEAPNLQLPKDVGFKIGGDSKINWLVLQIHYKDVDRFVKGDTDNSGLELQLSPQPTPNGAGVIAMGTSGAISATSIVYMETACKYKDKIDIYPFAYRTHAHSHGVVNSGYRIRDGKWTEIGRKSPQQPQMFYKVTNPGMDVKKGDILAARCTMVNKDNEVVQIGSTAKDEMCNFYIMYWTHGDHLPSVTNCWTFGPPQWNWGNFEDQRAINLKAEPKTASTDPNSHQSYKQTSLLKQIIKTAGAQQTTGDNSAYEYYNEVRPEDEQEMRDRILAEQYDQRFEPDDEYSFLGQSDAWNY